MSEMDRYFIEESLKARIRELEAVLHQAELRLLEYRKRLSELVVDVDAEIAIVAAVLNTQLPSSPTDGGSHG
jgi:hypothetical protein